MNDIKNDFEIFKYVEFSAIVCQAPYNMSNPVSNIVVIYDYKSPFYSVHTILNILGIYP